MQGVYEALDERFDTIDELKDIARHGCEGGVSGFIYDHELREFFFTYEDEIESIITSLRLYGGLFSNTLLIKCI